MPTPRTKATAAAPATEPEKNQGFLKFAVELSHSWEVTDTQPLTQAEKDAIKEVRVKQGQYGLQMSFAMKDGNTRVMNISQFCDLKVGDRVRISSISIDELYDSQEDRTIYRAYGQAL